MSDEAATTETATESKTYTQDEVQALIEEQTGGLKKKVDELLGEKKSASQKARDLKSPAARQKKPGRKRRASLKRCTSRARPVLTKSVTATRLGKSRFNCVT